MSIAPAGPDTAPLRLRVPDITGPQHTGILERVKRGAPDRLDALLCLAMYRMQATQLDQDQRREIIEIITKGHFLKSKKAKKSLENHSLYRPIQEKNFAAEYLTWPSYLIMHALYRGNLPPQYIGEIERKFGTAIIENFSSRFFEYYPDEGKLFDVTANIYGAQQSREYDILILAIMIDNDQSGPEKKIDNKGADCDETGAKDDDLPAPKRQKASHTPETQKTLNSTTESSSVITPDVTSSVNLDVCDLRGLLSKPSQKDSQSEDHAASGVLKRSRAESSLQALEESQRNLIAKFDTMTAAFDAMNNTMEKIVTKASTDREEYNRTLGTIRDVLAGVAGAIKEQL